MLRLLFILSLLVSSCNGSTKLNDSSQTAIDYQKQLAPNSFSADSLLSGIQNKINQTFIQSLILHNDEELIKLGDKLNALYKTKNQNIILYWQAYLHYDTSIFYLQQNDKKKAANAIDQGVDLLKNMKNKNSEDYALLAMLQSFSIQFQSMNAFFISAEVSKNIKNALEIDSTNTRAYYVLASNDFYTPKKYGGGKKTEKYLLKAIALPAQKIPNNYLPSWGKEEAYEMLIRNYIQNQQWDLAKKYYQQGIKAYPQSYMINQLASQLVGK